MNHKNKQPASRTASKQIESLGDLDETDREAVIGAIENLGLDSIFREAVKRTDSLTRITYTAWEMMADGMGEDDGHKALVDEINEAFKRRK